MQEAQEFLAHVLPPDGPYVLAYISKTRKGATHKSFDTIESMAKAATDLSKKGLEVYTCVGSILDKEFTNDNGKKVPRNQKNIKSLQSLILDIDVKAQGEKDWERFYNTKQEALTGLVGFIKTLGLPMPTIIDSGGGFHVWFGLSPVMRRFDWTSLAFKLKTAAGIYDPKIIADSSRVMDCASLLRIVGTNNYKLPGNPRPVRKLQTGPLESPYRYDEAFNAYLADKQVTIDEIPVPEHLQGKATVDLMIGDDPHNFVDVLKKCNWTREYMKHQRTEPEPHWYAMLGMVPYLRAPGLNSQQIAHLISKEHPSYSPTDTDRKFEQARTAQRGPTTCARFKSLIPERCKGCVFANQVNTPVRLDSVDVPADAPTVQTEIITETGEVKIETTTIPKPPFPYFRGKNSPGIYMQVGDGEDSETRRIYEYDMFPVRRLKDEETDSELLEISLTLPHDGHKLIKISNALLTDPKRLTGALAEKGVLVHPREATSVTTYVIEYARKIQREEKAHEEFARFGWRGLDSAEPRFVMGDFVIDTKGDMRPVTTASYLQPYRKVLSCKGTLEDWKIGFNVYKDMDDQAMPLRFALMMAFAAPLFALTSFHGLIYNMLGDSGSGKSTALKLMSSVWGVPDEHHLQVHDNRIPMFNTIGYLQSIPITFDEMTTIDSEALADISYAVSEGRGKNRADRTGNTRTNTTQWKTLVCGTSNASLYEKLGMSRSGNNAHAYRIFEVSVGAADLANRPAVEGALALTNNNYGMAGRIFITYVLKNIEQIKRQIAEATKTFAAKFNMPTAERFWFTLFACIAVGGQIAKKLGLHDYDLNKIILWSAEQLLSVRKMVHTVEGDAFSIFAHFLQTNIRSTLIVDSGKPNFLNIDSAGVFNLLVRYEYVNKMPTVGYISVPAIRSFCKIQGIEYGWLYKRLLDGNLIQTIENKKLGEGTHMMTGTTQAWRIDLNHPAITNGNPQP